jgi:hypothetical protein
VVEESLNARARRALESLLQGVGQGGTLGFGDELGFSDAETQREAPIAFGLGEAAGALGWGLAGIRGLRPLARAFQRAGLSERAATVAAASAFGGLHGAAAGYGGAPGSEASQSDLFSGERLQSALPDAAVGAAIGGAFVPTMRAAADLGDNLPAILGRQRVATDSGPDVWRQVMPGTGTRQSAPLNVSLAGEGAPEDRALAAIQNALRQDEAGAMRAGNGQSVFGRFAGPDGRTMTPWEAPQAGDSVRGLIDAATRAPGGAGRVNQMADDLIAQAAALEARNLRVAAAPRGQGRVTVRRSPVSRQDAADILSAVDDPAAHNSWMTQVMQMTPAQRRGLGRQLVAQMRADAGNAEAFRARLRDPQMQQKMQALGVDVRQFQRGARQVPADVDQRAAALRDRTQGQGRQVRNVADRELVSRGRLRDEDALALIEQAMQPQRAYRVPADMDARLFRGEFERGMRFNPQEYLNIDPSVLHAAVFASQPVAAFSHSVPYMIDRE